MKLIAAINLKHLAAVEKVGRDDSIPLIVVLFWSLDSVFALKTFYVIVDRTTPRSGVPAKLARNNLLQQLSVALWLNMILRYWALQGIDNDDSLVVFPYL